MGRAPVKGNIVRLDISSLVASENFDLKIIIRRFHCDYLQCTCTVLFIQKISDIKVD